MPRTHGRRRILLYCNRFSKVVRIRAAPGDQQRGAGQRYQSMLEWWSREQTAAQLSLECLIMYNFRVGGEMRLLAAKAGKPEQKLVVVIESVALRP